MTQTNTKKHQHKIVVRDFGPGGTGINVVVHRLGCTCRSQYDQETVVETHRAEAHVDEHKFAGVIAQRHGLAWFDFSISDCALF